MENKPYKLTKADAITLQNHCKEIKSILDKYLFFDLNHPNFVTSVSRIKSLFDQLSNWIDTAFYVDSND